MAVRAAVLGASGRMGRLVLEALEPGEIAAIVGRQPGAVGGHRIATLDGPAPFADADVVVDFSSPDALLCALPLLGPGVALVSGTTGLGDAHRAALADRARVAPVLHAANFSLGVAVLLDLARRAAAALPGFDVEIVEAHHRRKKDAPSGTALALAGAVRAGRGVDLALVHGREGLTGERPSDEIGMHALRGGDTVGDHTVWLAGPGERVELRHVATSRATFAAGAVRAARWLAGRPPGAYGLADVLADASRA